MLVQTQGNFAVCLYPRWSLWRLMRPRFWSSQHHVHLVKETTYQEAFEMASDAAESGCYWLVDLGTAEEDGSAGELLKRWVRDGLEDKP